MQMGQALPSLQRADISQLGQLGGIQQAQAQAEADASREKARLTAFEPYERLNTYGSGVMGLISGMPSRYTSTVTPNPTPLQTALGTGAVLSGIYGNLGGINTGKNNIANQYGANYLGQMLDPTFKG